MTRTWRTLSWTIGIASLLPLLLVHQEMWDGVIYEMGYIKHDLSYLDPILWMGKYLTFALWSFFEKLVLVTGLPHKFFTNALTVVSIVGVFTGIRTYLEKQFGISDKAACIGGWLVLAYPAWHVFMSGSNSDYVFYLWLFLAAVNLRHKHPLPALLLLVVSLQFYSIFALAVGFACTDFVMTADRKNWRDKTLRTFLFSAALLAGFVLLKLTINIHGAEGADNTFKLDRLTSFVHFGIMAACVVGILAIASLRMRDKSDAERLIRLGLAFLVLSFFAGLAYWAIGRPMRFFAFGSYTARHTILCTIPLALLVAAMADFGFRAGKRKLVHFMAGFLVTASIVLLYQGYEHKIAALLFKDMMVQSFREIPEPESGYVSIEPDGYKAPRHFHSIDTNMAMYKAYGKSAWMANGFWARRGFVYDRQALDDEYSRVENRKWNLTEDVSGDAFTKYLFTLTNYHQEGRLWYWYSYLAKDYACFNPKLTRDDTGQRTPPISPTT